MPSKNIEKTTANELIQPSQFNTQMVAGFGAESAQAIHAEIVKMTQAEFKSAIVSKQFSVRLQMVVELKTRRLVGFESLIRWKHPIFGALRPIFFLKPLIAAGLSQKITEYMLARAARFQVHAIAARKTIVPIYVNISGAQFQHENLYEIILGVINRYNLPAGAIAVEMTETDLVVDIVAAASVIRKLREIGVDVLADDFGHAFASIRNLLDYDYNGFKLDRSFITSLDNNPKSAIVVAHLAHLAKKLNMTMTAEGIETEQQAASIAELGVQQGQGYLFGKPMSRLTALALLPDADAG